MSWAIGNGTRLYYEVHGSGPGVLFVHGSGGHHAAWWQQVPALRDDYTVITMDLRGFGRSRWDGRARLGGLPRRHRRGAGRGRRGRGSDRAVLVGQSIGAPAALRAALDRPDRAAGVVLAHSLGGIRHSELAELVRADRAAAVKLPVLDRLLTPEFRARTRIWRSCSSRWGRSTPRKWPTCATWAATARPSRSSTPRPSRCCCWPASGTACSARPPSAGPARCSAHARVEIVPGAPHSMYWETPALFNDALSRFLADVTAAGVTRG